MWLSDNIEFSLKFCAECKHYPVSACRNIWDGAKRKIVWLCNHHYTQNMQRDKKYRG